MEAPACAGAFALQLLFLECRPPNPTIDGDDYRNQEHEEKYHLAETVLAEKVKPEHEWCRYDHREARHQSNTSRGWLFVHPKEGISQGRHFGLLFFGMNPWHSCL